MKIYFEGIEVDNDSIIGLANDATIFTDKFELGATVCREINLDVLRDGVSNDPNTVTFTDDNDNALYYMHVDSRNDDDYTYYHYVLMDSMVLLNRSLDFSECVIVDDVLNLIMTTFGIAGIRGLSNTIANQEFPWDGYSSPREVVGWIAEACGGYAYIDGDNYLVFKSFSTTVIDTISDESCSDLRVGAYHEFSRVVFDNGVVHYEAGTMDAETLYLNTENVLFSDDASTDIQTLVNSIAGSVSGLAFYDIEVTNCDIANAMVGDLIEVAGYNTICQEQYSYNGAWIGGYSFEVSTEEQQETQVVDRELNKAVNTIQSQINRQQGTLDIIASEINGIDDKLIHFQVNSNDVRISRESGSEFNSYTSFKDDGMRIYVNGEQVAEATATIFECNKGLGVQDWAITQPNNDPNVLCFYRR